MTDWGEEVDRVREKAAVREIVEACCAGITAEPPRPATPRAPEQPAGSRPSYATMVDALKASRPERVS